MNFTIFRSNIKSEFLPKIIDKRIDDIYQRLIKEHGDKYKKYLLNFASKETDELKTQLTKLEEQVNYLQDVIDQVDNVIMKQYYDVDTVKSVYKAKIEEGEDLLITFLAYSKIDGLSTAYKRLNDSGLRV